MPTGSSLSSDLHRLVHGFVTTEHQDLLDRARDYGRVLSSEPQAVVRPADADDVAAILRYATANSVPVTVQAAAHSQGGQSLAVGGILLDMYGFGRVETVDRAASTMRVGSGVLWRDVARAALENGMVPPVLTDNLFTTVGGTASVAGVGFSSYRFGTQIDNHLEIELVSGAGERFSCSAVNQPELFACALGGLGQFGVVTSVRHRLRAYPRYVRQTILLYANLEPMLDDVQHLIAEGHADYLRCGTVQLSGKLRFLLGVDSESESDSAAAPPELDGLQCSTRASAPRVVPFADFVLGNHVGTPQRFARDESVVAPGLDLIIPAVIAAQFVSSVLAELPITIRNQSKFLLLFLRRKMLKRPMFIVPDADELVLLTMECIGPREQIESLLAVLDDVDAQGRRAGATRYLAGTVRYDAAQWRQHYGQHWQTIRQVKAANDPARVLTSHMHPFDLGQ